MSRVITFSTRFPTYHPRKGEPTGFVKALLRQQNIRLDKDYYHLIFQLNYAKLKGCELTENQLFELWQSVQREDEPTHYKLHTIRAGHRWKAGDKFSPRVWSGVPYHSPQIIIAPDMEVKKTWNIEMDRLSVVIDKYKIYRLGDEKVAIYEKLAQNDGLDVVDFCYWFKFPAPFDGQIICWDENVNY